MLELVTYDNYATAKINLGILSLKNMVNVMFLDEQKQIHIHKYLRVIFCNYYYVIQNRLQSKIDCFIIKSQK